MSTAEIKTMEDVQLVHHELGLERELVQNQFRHRLGQLSNTSVLGDTRREIARVKTELTRREALAGFPKGTLRARHASTFTPAQNTAQETGGGFLKGLMDQGESP